jgi:DNA-binding NarL/FixJ family response regulator
VLQRAGYETVEVATGTEVLAAIRAGDVALVVTEVGLSDMTGYEVCREIRVRNEELPVFFLSGIRREPIEVLELLAEERRQKEIAHALSISAKTVGTHVQNLLSKFEVHSRAELVARAYRENLAGSAAK